MNKPLMLAAAALCVAAPWTFAADTAPRPAAEAEAKPEAPADKPARRVEKRIRVVSNGDGPHVIRLGDDKDMPKEIVTFLGVETSPVDPALVAQLNLKRGMGLTVRRVVPDSPAATVLKEHDVLTKLNDQWLVDQHQLAVLVQSYNEGDEVALTFVRAGKEQTAKAKLTKKERPKLAQFNVPVPGPGGDGFRWTQAIPGGFGGAEGVHERLQALRELHGSGGQHDVIINRGTAGGGPGSARISILRMPDAVMLFKDEAGAVELKNEEGKRLLEVRDAKDKVTFNGEVTTPEQREKLPADVKARLELVEAKDLLEFVPEGDATVETRSFVEEQPGGEKIRSRPAARALGNPVMRL